jgi:hypothetical protein
MRTPDASPSTAERVWPVLAILVASLVPFWRCLAFGETVGPFGQILQMAPFRQPAPSGGWDVLQADGVLQFGVWRALVLDSWAHGHLPAWNPYTLMGTALLGNSQSGALYPAHVLLGLARVGPWAALTLLAVFHVFLAGLGCRALVLRLGGTDAGATAAGALFALSPFLLSWASLASVPSTVAWLPWLLAAAWSCGQGQPRAWVWLSLTVAMTLLAGHLQFAAYSVVAGLALGLVSAWRSWAGLLPLAAGIALGLGLAAPQVLPVLEFGKSGHRRTAPTAEGWAAYSASALGPVDLLAVVHPGATGLAAESVEGGAPGYWPSLVKRGGNFAEAALGIGPAALAGLALLRRRRWGRGHSALLAVGVLGLGLALGPLSAVLYFGFPGWASTGSPGRAAVLAVLAACSLAGLAWPGDRLSSGDLRLVGYWVGGGLVLTLLTLTLAQNSFRSWVPGLDGVLPRLVAQSTVRALPMMAIGTALALASAFALGRSRTWTAVALAVAAGASWGAWRAVPTGRPDFGNAGLPSPDSPRIAAVNDDWGLLAPATDAVYPPNTAVLAGRRDVGGYDSLIDAATYGRLTEANAGRDPAPEANGNMVFVKPGFDEGSLAECGVTVVIDKSGERPLLGPGRADVGGRPARITAERTWGLKVQAEGPGTLTVRDRNLPGWTASVGGRDQGVGDGFFLAVELPPGEQTVELRYEPPGLRTGALLALFSSLALLASIIAGRLKKPPADGVS